MADTVSPVVTNASPEGNMMESNGRCFAQETCRYFVFVNWLGVVCSIFCKVCALKHTLQKRIIHSWFLGMAKSLISS